MSEPARRKTFERYGLEWPAGVSDVEVLRSCIQLGGQFANKEGRIVGAPLFDLYRELQTLLWPDDDHHDWSDLMLRTVLVERITVIQGPKDCGKTHVALSKFGLTDFLCFPSNTLILMSSTDIRGLELRVWGDLKDLFVRAKEVWPQIPGNPIDSLHGIFTDSLSEDADVRDVRKGIICIPCVESSGQWKGLEKYTGIKQKRRRLLGDEVQFMEAPYITSLANLNKQKSDFKGVFVGNPIGEGDCLDKLAEPSAGWDSLGEITETTTWRNRMGGVTIQLFGPDSPAIKNPGEFSYLIDDSDIAYIVNYWGKDSSEYWNQAAGVRRPGVSERRIVTRDMALQFHAFSAPMWGSGPITKLYAIDAGYGGDRCIGGEAEFGIDVTGRQILAVCQPRLIPVRLFPKSVPAEQRLAAEDQIVEYAKADCERLEIEAAHLFYDATGRGTMGSAFSRLWRHDTVPVEFGGSPSLRPVTSDLYIYDERLRQKRLKRCDEHYSKRVSELAFSVRYTILGDQLRDLSQDVLEELCAREWKRVKQDKIEVETKEEMKERFGRSPDKADWIAIIVEGARQLGFQITQLRSDVEEQHADNAWKDNLRQRAAKLRASYTLTYR